MRPRRPTVIFFSAACIWKSACGGDNSGTSREALAGVYGEGLTFCIKCSKMVHRMEFVIFCACKERAITSGG
jgi:hypothetical protein